MSAQLSYRHILGLKGNVRNNIWYLDDNLLVYPSGHNTIIYDTNEKSQKFIQCTDGTLGITAMAVSPCLRYIAISEKSQRGIISIYDLQTLKKRKVLTTTECSSTEYVSLCFSNDKMLLSQGGAPDWSIVLWHWEKAKSLYSLKVSDGSPVASCSFNPADPTICCAIGNNIFSVYRVVDNMFKPMPDMIGQLSEECNKHFTSHSWLTGDRIILGTSTGQVILYEAGDYVTILDASPNDDLEISAIQSYSSGFLTGSVGGLIRVFEVSDEPKVYYKEIGKYQIPNLIRPTEKVNSIAVSPIENKFTCTMSNNQIYTMDLIQSDPLNPTEVETLSISYHGPGENSTARSALLTGMDVCVRKPLVATCGQDRTVRVWNYTTKTMELEKTYSEDPCSLAFHPSGLHMLVGFSDKLRLLNILIDDIRLSRELPIKGCRECQFSNGGHLFAAVSGNTIQIFNTYNGMCITTLRGHNGKVRSLFWGKHDDEIISSGMDGAVYQWDLKESKRDGEYIKKGCNYFAAISNQDGSAVFAVGSDRVFREIEFPVSTVTKEIECDVALGQIVLSNSQRLLFAGTAEPSRPGCVRSYKFPLTGEFVEYQCLSSPIIRMRLTKDDSYLIVGGEDGSMCVLDVRDERVKRGDQVATSYAEEVLVTKTDLEEKNSVMVELKNKVDELTLHNEYELRLKDMNYNEKIKEVTEKYRQELEQDKNRYELLREEKNELRMDYEEKLKLIEEKQMHEVQELETSYQTKIMAEVERYQVLCHERDTQKTHWDDQQRMLLQSHELYVNEITEDYEQKLEEDKTAKDEMALEKKELISEFEETKKQLEEDIDQEIEELKAKYEAKLNNEREATLRYKGENGIMKKKFSALQKDIEAQREEIKIMLDKEQELIHQIRNLDKEIKTLKSQIRDRDDTIGEKEKRIYDLKKKNQELEKFKFVLDYKIKELKRQIEPRENEITDMKEQIKEMDQELEQYHKSNAGLDNMIGELRTKLDKMQNVIMRNRQKIADAESRIVRFKSDLHECTTHIQDPERLKEAIQNFYQLHVQQLVKTNELSLDIQREYHRQKGYLEKSLEALKHRLNHDMAQSKKENSNIMHSNMLLIKDIQNLREEIRIVKMQNTLAEHEAKHRSKHGKSQSQSIAISLDSPKSTLSNGSRGPSPRTNAAFFAAAQPSSNNLTEEEVALIEAQKQQIGAAKARLQELEEKLIARRPHSREKLAPL